MRHGTSATEGAWQNRGSPPRSEDETGSRQLVQWRLGVLQDRRVETFGEPAIDGREEIAGFGALALITPEAGEVEGRTQPNSLAFWCFRDSERLVKGLLSSGPQ
jgi:hypothetical protein